jgi:hypothetical protein
MAPKPLVDDASLIAALKECGSISAAARAVGLSRRAVQHRIPTLAKRGWSPEHGLRVPYPDGYRMGKVTIHRNAAGEIKNTWERMCEDDLRQAEMQQAVVEALQKDVFGLWAPFKAPKSTLEDSLSAYMIGDAHFGLYAWAAEAGEDFDTSIASKDLRGAIDRLVGGAPPSATGYLVDVGDFLHANSRVASTPASGNQLDVDGRYPRVIDIAIDALRYCVGRMLQKHKRVEFFSTPGNHNPDAARWMARVLAAYFCKDSRVSIETSPSQYFYRRFGNNLIGVTHGDKTKMADLPSIMATDRARDWGETEHRYWWTGHIHHTRHQEFRGCFVESFNTLAASDAWHHESGYRSNRQMQRIDLNRQDGIVGRQLCTVRMLRRGAAGAQEAV